MHYLLFYIFSLLCLSIPIYSQYSNLKFDHITIENGLSSKLVKCFIQDKHGFMWIGTKRGGLNKYDGYTFTCYTKDTNTKNSISDNDIHCLFESKDGLIWIGTNNGLNVFDPIKEEFTVYQYNSTKKNSISSNNINAITEDKDGILWIGTNNGLNKFDRETGKFNVFYYDPKNPLTISDNRVSALLIDSKGTFWVATMGAGINRFEKDQEVFERILLDARNEKVNMVTSICEGKNNLLWIGTLNGLVKIDILTNNFYIYRNIAGDNSTLTSNDILCLFGDANDKLWIGTGYGLSKYNYQKDCFNNYLFDESDPYGINSNGIFSIYKNKNNIIWIGTSEGIDLFDMQSNLFNHYREGSLTNNSIEGKIIKTIFEDSDSLLWIGTRLKGINIIDRKKQIVNHLTNYPNFTKSICDNNISGIVEDKLKNIWIATYNGLIKYNKKTGKINNYNNNPSSNTDNYFSSIFIDSKSRIWLGNKKGVCLFNPLSNSFINYPILNYTSISNVNIVCITEYVNELWLGSARNGLYRFNPETGDYKVYTEYSKDKNKLECDFVKSIYIDKKNNLLWIGHLQGLENYNLKTGKFTYFNNLGKLGVYTVTGITGDLSGNLWLSTRNHGIIKFNPLLNKIEIYDSKDGLQSNFFIDNSVFQSKSGEIFFGGSNGFNSFFPNQIYRETSKSPLVFTDFQILNKRINSGPSSPLKVNINYAKRIKLSSKNKIISFEFALLNFRRTSKNLYAYKLEGLEDTWNYCYHQRKVTYTNLEPGRYTLKIIASPDNGNYSNEATSLKIIISPPFYKSWWFTLFLIIILVTGSIGFYIRRITQIKRNQLTLEKLVAEQTAEVMKQKDEIEIQRDEINIQKDKIDKQRQEIILKNYDITSSLNYAYKIQSAILPPDSLFKKLMPNSFILYIPKGIVSGDFYWIGTMNNNSNEIYFASIDCTGHGVPGAFMSLIGNILLNQALKEQNLSRPSDILNYLDHEIKSNLRRAIEGSRDGMDLTLCRYIRNKNLLEFAGAKNDLYLVRNNTLEIFKTDNYSVGMQDFETLSFLNQELELQKGDIIYICSDGFQDQYGGPNDKRYSKRKLKEKLLEINSIPLNEQKNILHKELINWKGNKEQTDDILLMGFQF